MYQHMLEVCKRFYAIRFGTLYQRIDNTGFIYDYETQMVKLCCENHLENKRFEFCFQQVVAINAQSCCFWGSSNRIYDVWIDDNPEYFEKLLRIQKENAELYCLSYLDRGVSYVSIAIQLVSGDDIRITCKSIEVEVMSIDD